MQLINTDDPGKHISVTIGKWENAVLTKRVKPEHFFRLHNGYGIQSSAMSQLEKIGTQIVRVIEPSGRTLEVDFNTWKIFGIKKNYGHGEQSFLDVSYMTQV